MPISATKDRVERSLLEFAWNEWAQLGVLSAVRRRSTWAQDLEPLLVFSLNLARADPRLFDAILDWLVGNEELLSVRRLRTIARDSVHPSLAEAALAWVAQDRPKARFSRPAGHAPVATPSRLFFDDGFPLRHADGAFLEHGWRRPALVPSGKGGSPDLATPIAFGLRLRRMFGPSARAEVVRTLLCIDAPRVSATVIVRSAAYTRRNVLEALRELTDAGLVTSARIGHETRYGIDHERWATLLSAEQPFPGHVEWVQLLHALDAMLEWLRSGVDDDATDYMVGSSARQLLQAVEPDLAWAGIHVKDVRASDALAELSRVLDRCLELVAAS